MPDSPPPRRPSAPPKVPVRPPLSPRAEATFNSALERPPAERAAFVAKACGDETALHAEVRELLAAHEGAAGFMAEGETLSPEVEREMARLKPEEGGEMIGPYKLREQIGEGGFGTVWVADQEKPVRRRVALKIIKLGMDTKEVIARFEQERQALAMMDHPNIAKVLDAGATQFGRPFFVMELVRGVIITEYCDEQQLSTRHRIELFITVCQAVQHAHQKGIIHRDLKPSNVLVTMNDGKAVPKVIDFGVAKATQGRLTEQTVYTQFQQMIGTPLYMSPEQAEMTSLDIDTRSDIYSLGVLLYELLTGYTPIAKDTLARAGMDEIRRIIREVDPPRPSMRMKTLDGAAMTTAAQRRNTEPAKLPGTLRDDIDWIVMKCLEKDRSRRYDTANGLALDLERHLRNEVVIARPPTAGYLLSKLVRRNQLAFAAGTAIVASLVIGLAASLWQAVRATRAEREQSQLRAVAVQALEGEKAQRTQAEAERQRAEINSEKARATALQSRRNQYAADMFSSTINIEKGSYATARNFLREYFPREGVEELRGFEWRYGWQLCAGQQLKTFPLGGGIEHAAWSPDGRLVATAHRDGAVRLSRADTGEVTATFQDCAGADNSLAFSSDGNGLAAAGHDAATRKSVVRFLDVRDGRSIFTLTQYPAPRVACSPAGPLMA
ncbi:MAG: protein kinase, partial [Chthoniobacter sp.]|uniref:WD40 repeat domain-containing serine/threonine protein kinase n=1 Tax=Chthoniobacter sp. TaxID=2510640 RepID=UPI0032A9E38A